MTVTQSEIALLFALGVALFLYISERLSKRASIKSITLLIQQRAPDDARTPVALLMLNGRAQTIDAQCHCAIRVESLAHQQRTAPMPSTPLDDDVRDVLNRIDDFNSYFGAEQNDDDYDRRD